MSARNLYRVNLSKTLSKVKAVNRAATPTLREVLRRELEEYDEEARERAAAGGFSGRGMLPRGADAVAVVERYRSGGLRGKELRDAVTKHAQMVRSLDPEFADLILETPLVSQATRKKLAREVGDADD